MPGGTQATQTHLGVEQGGASNEDDWLWAWTLAMDCHRSSVDVDDAGHLARHKPATRSSRLGGIAAIAQGDASLLQR